MHLAEHMERLLPRFAGADLVIALDSFCESYDRLWTTTSTRGVCGGVLEIEVCLDDPHSGRASGVLPSSFRILRQLLDRIEDADDRRGAVRHGERADPVVPHRRGARSPLRRSRRCRVVPPAARRALDARRRGRGADRRDVAAGARGDRRRWPAARGRRRQRVPLTARGEALAAPAADGRHVGGRRGDARPRSRPIRRTALASSCATALVDRGGRRRRSRPGSPRRPHRRACVTSVRRSRRAGWAARSRSWACSADRCPTRSSCSSACSVPGRTHTDPTSSSTCPPLVASPPSVADVLRAHAERDA